MKLLLTGEPRSGKTTLLMHFLDSVANKQGFITREVLEDGQRIGFELVDSSGRVATLASIKSGSPIRVSRYGVNVAELDNFIAGLPNVKPSTLLYIDEIGQMELYSDNFKQIVQSYLDAKNIYAGTISSVYKDDFIKQVLARDDVVLLKISPDNRQQITEILNALATSIDLLTKLDSSTQINIIKMAKVYAQTYSYVQLKKLFKNAIKYCAENRVSQINSDIFAVKGDHASHKVSKQKDIWSCDCDLFNGRNDYLNNAGECSHIQAAKIITGP